MIYIFKLVNCPIECGRYWEGWSMPYTAWHDFKVCPRLCWTVHCHQVICQCRSPQTCDLKILRLVADVCTSLSWNNQLTLRCCQPQGDTGQWDVVTAIKLPQSVTPHPDPPPCREYPTVLIHSSRRCIEINPFNNK